MTMLAEELARIALYDVINQNPKTREELAAKFPDTADTTELQETYDVESFLAPFVILRRKSDGIKGCMVFQHNPRFYFHFQELPAFSSDPQPGEKE